MRDSVPWGPVGQTRRMQLRTSTPGDRAWIDATYREIDFQPSPEGTRHVLAQEGDGIVGVGRLIDMGALGVELGGMYVAPDQRGKGTARAIVEELVAMAPDRTVWCIPFVSLVPFYRSCGLESPPGDVEVPAPLRSRMSSCDATHDEAVTLLFRRANATSSPRH